jgi:hypothetical protein
MSDEFSDEFLRGQNDCFEGIPHKPDQSEAYDRGYSAQYHLEAELSELTSLQQRQAI